jgi:ubiquinone/menaquinone biosynthesis C-methylase UbiE/transcriptional regulator with XRE-family HTH domain
MQISQLFRAQRLRLGLSQAELAQRAQLNVTTVRRLEAGQAVQDETLAALANVLRIPRQQVVQALQQTREAAAQQARQQTPEPAQQMQEEPARARRQGQDRMPVMRHAAAGGISDEEMRRAYENQEIYIPSEEEERRIQEIRRQRRRQAYEGTLNARRRTPPPRLEPEPPAPQRRQEPVQLDEFTAPAYERQPVNESVPNVREEAHRAQPEYPQTQQKQRPMQQEQTQKDAPDTAAQPAKEETMQTQTRQSARIPRMPRQSSSDPAQEGVARTYAQMLEVMADVAQLSGRETVLEIGCGQGALTRVLTARSRFVAALDTSARALEQNRAVCAAQGIENVDFLEGDARRLPIESDSFDIVFVPMLLHHVVSPAQVLMEARRVVKPGGRVVVAELMPSDVPAQQRIQNAVEVLKNATHIGVIPMQEVVHMMQRAHLQVADRRVLDQMWEFSQWVDAMGARDRMEPLRALMRSFALQGNRAGMDLSVDEDGRMTFIYRWMFLLGVRDE